jgi:hypothetical protein
MVMIEAGVEGLSLIQAETFHLNEQLSIVVRQDALQVDVPKP